jgi:hypothetical protein
VLGELRDRLPTHVGAACAGLLAEQLDWGDMTRGVFSAVASAAAMWRIGRKDVTRQGRHRLLGQRVGVGGGTGSGLDVAGAPAR